MKQMIGVSATAFTALVLSSCFKDSIPRQLPKSEIQERAEQNDFVSGDLITPPEEFEKFCILNALDLDQHFSETEFRKYYDEDFFIVLKEFPDGVQDLAYIHDSWLLTPNGASLCSYGSERIIVEKVIDGGTVLLALDHT